MLIVGFVVALIAGIISINILIIEMSLSRHFSMIVFGGMFMAVGLGFGAAIKRSYANGPLPLRKKKATAIPIMIGFVGLVVHVIGLVGYLFS